MKIHTHWLTLSCLVCSLAPQLSSGQQSAGMRAKLKELAANDPKLAAALENLSVERTESELTEADFVQRVRVEWSQIRVSPNGRYAMSSGASGYGTVNATLGSTIDWTDQASGEHKSLSYEASIDFDADAGLVIDLSTHPDGEKATTQRYRFENLAPVSVVLVELADGSKYVARFVPVVDSGASEKVVDFGDSPVLGLDSAYLLADGIYAGPFGATGEIVSIWSSDIGKSFQFGLKPFANADVLGRTDGRTVTFTVDDQQYRLIAGSPIAALAPAGMYWNVYIRVGPALMGGFGSSAGSYDTLILQDAIKSIYGQ
jgi:hypothetical protein